jgi:hypothetical protein
MTSEYRIYCSIHQYQTKWSDTLVTTCPINPEDPINQDATCIINQLRPVSQISPTIKNINLPNPIRIGDAYYDINSMGTLSRIGFLSYCDVDVTSFTIEVYDKTNLKSLGIAEFSNTDEQINYIDNIVTELNTTQLEFFVKVNSPKKNNAYISLIILYAY